MTGTARFFWVGCEACFFDSFVEGFWWASGSDLRRFGGGPGCDRSGRFLVDVGAMVRVNGFAVGCRVQASEVHLLGAGHHHL